MRYLIERLFALGIYIMNSLVSLFPPFLRRAVSSPTYRHAVQPPDSYLRRAMTVSFQVQAGGSSRGEEEEEGC